MRTKRRPSRRRKAPRSSCRSSRSASLRPDEVLVEVAAAGICHTDLICRDQWLPVPLPAVLGHEGAGVVRAVGPSVTEVAPGDRVGMTFSSCGHCRTCLRGRSTYCLDFFGRNFGSSRPDGTTSLSRDGEPVHSHFFGQSSFAPACRRDCPQRRQAARCSSVRHRGAVRLRHPDGGGRGAQRPCDRRPGARS